MPDQSPSHLDAAPPQLPEQRLHVVQLAQTALGQWRACGMPQRVVHNGARLRLRESVRDQQLRDAVPDLAHRALSQQPALHLQAEQKRFMYCSNLMSL